MKEGQTSSWLTVVVWSVILEWGRSWMAAWITALW
jgi:hypothetical protein